MVEELREEIEHVVEHVPRPVRWTVRKLALLISLSLVALVVLLAGTALLYLGNRTEWVAQELTLFLNGVLAQRSDVVVEVADIRGNPLNQVELLGARVRFRDRQGPVVLETPRIRLGYSAWSLIGSRDRRIDVVIDSPVIRLARGADGRLRLPAWKTSGPARASSHTYNVRVQLRRGRLAGPLPLGAIEDLNLDALVSTARTTRVDLRDLRWSAGPYRSRNLRIQGEIVAGDSVHFRVRRLTSPDLALSAHGAWKKGSTERVLHADIARIRWGWLSEATGSKSFAVPGEGRVTVDARGSSAWRGAFDTRLTWNGLAAVGRSDFSWDGRRLLLAPLTLTSAAGRLEGRAMWSRQGWEIGGEAVGADPSNWSAIGIVGWPKGDLDGSFRYAVDSRRGGVARLDATLGASEVQGWRADRAGIAVDFPVGQPDSFRVTMERLGGTVTLDGVSTSAGWRGDWTAERFPLEEWPEGRASGIRGTVTRAQGSVTGRGGELHVTGALDGEATDWLGAHVARWRLAEVDGRLLPTPDLTARAALADVMFLGVHFDSAAIGLGLGDDTVRLETIRAAAGDTTFTAAGDAAWSASGWRLRFDRAQTTSRQFHWTAEPPVAMAGDPRGVVFDRLIARDGAARLEIAGRWAAPGGAFDWVATASDLDLARIGMPVELGLAGRTDARLEIDGAAEDPAWRLVARTSRPGWQGHLADSLALELAGRPSSLAVRRAYLAVGEGSVSARGEIHRMEAPWPDSLTAPAVTRWLAGGAAWEGEVRAERLALEPVAELAPAASGWAGALSGRLAIGGSPRQPTLEATAEASPLAWRGYRVDDLDLRARYRDERLRVEELRMNRGTLASTITGSMPLQLALGARPQVPEQPMDWRLDMPNGDLSVLPLFVSQIGAAAGRLEIAASIRGTPRHPDLDGIARVREGRIRMAGRDEVLTGVHADLRLDESRVTLDSLRAAQGEKGQVRAAGGVEVSGAGLKGYRFDLRMRDFTAVETGFYVALFDGDFVVTDGPRLNGQVLPNVTGRVDVQRAVVLFDFANQSEMQRLSATAQPLIWTYRLQVNAPGNLKWQPPDGDIEFRADLLVEQTAERLSIDGEMHALRGTYYFLSNRFNVTRADLTFHSFDGVDPVIDAEATTRVVPTQEPEIQVGSTGESRLEPHTVTVRIRGKSTEPVIEFASDPNDWDEARILRELTVGRFYAGGGVTLGDPLDNYLTRAINKTLSAEMSRVFRGYVSEWEVQREQGGILAGQGDVIVGVGTQITPNLLVRFRQRVPGLSREHTRNTATTNPFERDVEAEYRINRFLYVTSELTQRRTASGSSGGLGAAPEFNVNLKARWEY